ncbi:MAG: hypothetical protein HQL49_06805 [Gammaproteobacteria bacterium]|nr:hypothetical protein [Gammaproteobacteria bacterium]
MARAIFTLVVIILLVIFTSQNMDDVEIYLVTGEPMHHPKILIIGIAFALGYATATISFIISSSKRKREQQQRGELQRYETRRRP